MRRITKIFLMLTAGLFILVGCAAEEEFASFSLNAFSGMDSTDEETPNTYIVNHPEAKDQIVILRNEKISAVEFGIAEERFDLENVSVTDEEITIEYDGQVDTFSRLSESVVENEEGIWYEYFVYEN